jgi:hypothetical protein
MREAGSERRIDIRGHIARTIEGPNTNQKEEDCERRKMENRQGDRMNNPGQRYSD